MTLSDLTPRPLNFRLPALVLLLSPPQGAGAGWLFLCSALLFLGWTLVQIPYLAWGARLSPYYHERTRLTASRETAVIIGIEPWHEPRYFIPLLGMVLGVLVGLAIQQTHDH